MGYKLDTKNSLFASRCEILYVFASKYIYFASQIEFINTVKFKLSQECGIYVIPASQM